MKGETFYMFSDKLYKDNPLVNTDEFKKHQETFEKNLGEYALSHEKSAFAVDTGLKAISSSLYEQTKYADISSKIEALYSNIQNENSGDSPIVSMLNACKKHFNRKDLLNFRLALIGFELSKENHKSLYEILSESRNAGVAGQEDLLNIVSMDASAISPLSKDEIKNYCYEIYTIRNGRNRTVYKLPPIDLTFLEKFSYIDHIDQNQSSFASSINDYLKCFDNNFSPAVYAYVNQKMDSHYLINSYLGFMDISDSAAMNNFFKIWARKYLSSPNFKYRKGTAIQNKSDKQLDSDIDDMKSITSTIMSSLHSAKKYDGVVYRGDWASNIASKFKEGSTINYSSFCSTSNNWSNACSFVNLTMNNMSKSLAHGVLFIIDLKGKAGVDISGINSAEQEILIMPGAKFKVKKIFEVNGKNTPHNFVQKLEAVYSEYKFKKTERNLKKVLDVLGDIMSSIPEEILSKMPQEIHKFKKNSDINNLDAKNWSGVDDSHLDKTINIFTSKFTGIKSYIDSFILLEEIDNESDISPMDSFNLLEELIESQAKKKTHKKPASNANTEHSHLPSSKNNNYSYDTFPIYTTKFY